MISLKVSTVSGLELIIDSTSAIKVLSASSLMIDHLFLVTFLRYLLLFEFGVHTHLPYVMLQVGSCATKSN